MFHAQPLARGVHIATNGSSQNQYKNHPFESLPNFALKNPSLSLSLRWGGEQRETPNPTLFHLHRHTLSLLLHPQTLSSQSLSPHANPPPLSAQLTSFSTKASSYLSTSLLASPWSVHSSLLLQALLPPQTPPPPLHVTPQVAPTILTLPSTVTSSCSLSVTHQDPAQSPRTTSSSAFTTSTLKSM